MGILDEVKAGCAQFGVTISEAFPPPETHKRSREQPIVSARWTVFVALEARGWSAHAIGKMLGFHHTTVADGLKKMGALGPQKKDAGKPTREGGIPRKPAGDVQSTTDDPEVQVQSEGDS
jgi:hypothetical protein